MGRLSKAEKLRREQEKIKNNPTLQAVEGTKTELFKFFRNYGYTIKDKALKEMAEQVQTAKSASDVKLADLMRLSGYSVHPMSLLMLKSGFSKWFAANSEKKPEVKVEKVIETKKVEPKVEVTEATEVKEEK